MPATATLTDDLFAPEVIADPYTYFGRLREIEPVHWNERFSLWLVTGYDELVWILRHNELFSSAVIRDAAAPPYPPVDPADVPLFDEIRDFRADQLVEKDRPEHFDQRSVVHGYFTPKAMEKWRPFVRAAVEELLDDIQPKGAMDVLTELAAPLPVRIIAEMMGVPYEDRDRLRAMADGILYINRGEPYRFRPLVEAIRGIVDYAAPLVEERIGGEGSDFISVLAGGETCGVFTRHQVLVNTGLLLFAGHETTMNLICNGLLSLIRHPEQWERLRADPEGMARLATEECLRYDPPVKSTQRIVAEDVDLGGRTMRKGQRIRWIMAAANRDPEVFSRADEFDIGRQPNPHLSFGSGIHYCLGATLARVEGQEVFRALAERFERFELAGRPIEYQPSLQFRSVKSLPVRWTA
ncbi:MAG: cytochrome P450 [Gemmatimonadetes bacterium]|nr:cytochrome P450 [Gemmatimonadota bacterium]MYG23762.1 cytochrome P450 [Gemmatimonadota bacterium]MYJ39596.1 cytochrome P450 [Gemmatimonadota bacterium]